MYYYIEKNVGVTAFEQDLNRELYNNIGETWQDYLDGCWVPLTEQQIEFYTQNSNASTKEVFDMQLAPGPSAEVMLARAKDEMLHAIENYDKSDDVNSFTINGLQMWLTVEERQQLLTQLQMHQAVGRENMTKWFNGQQFTFPLSAWQQMLAALEIYAGDALNVTEQHKAEVEALSSIEAVQAYNYQAGYPTKLNF